MAQFKLEGEWKSKKDKLRKEINDIKSGKKEVNLTDSQEKFYQNRLDPELQKILKHPGSRKDFLISELESKINMNELYAKLDYCRKHGHEEKKGSSYFASGSHTGTRVYAYCSRCGQMYERNLTAKEREEFDKIMHTPMTI